MRSNTVVVNTLENMDRESDSPLKNQQVDDKLAIADHIRDSVVVVVGVAVVVTADVDIAAAVTVVALLAPVAASVPTNIAAAAVIVQYIPAFVTSVATDPRFHIFCVNMDQRTCTVVAMMQALVDHNCSVAAAHAHSHFRNCCIGIRIDFVDQLHWNRMERGHDLL